VRAVFLTLIMVLVSLPGVSFSVQREACSAGCCEALMDESCCGEEPVASLVAGCCCDAPAPKLPVAIDGGFEYVRPDVPSREPTSVELSAFEPVGAAPSSVRMSPETPPPRVG